MESNFWVRLPHPTSKSWNVSNRKSYVRSWTHHGMCRTLLFDAISTCQRSRKKSATTALTTASASVYNQMISSYPSSSHLNTGDSEDSCPSICLPDSSVIVVISTLVCKTSSRQPHKAFALVFTEGF
jgi:hypothetical protein